MGWQFVDWIYLAEGRDQWRDLLNTVINFGFLEGEGGYCLAERLSTI